jgi:ADP-ribose pyrophosphatase
MRLYTPPNAVLVPDQAERVFKGLIFDVYHWPQKMFDGSTQTFEMIRRPDSVNIIAVHEGKIILNKESQPHAGEFITFPAGMHDHEEESELEGAKRELLEETGYLFNDWKLIATEVQSKKIEQISYTFLATNLKSIQPQNLDTDGEKIEVTLVTFEELKATKNDPRMRFYPTHVLDQLSSLEELLALPSLYQYPN